MLKTKLLLSSLLLATFGLAAHADVDSSQKLVLPLTGTAEIKVIKPIQLPAVKSGSNEVFTWLFSIKDGKIQYRSLDSGEKPADEPACVLMVHYGYDDINTMGKTGHYPALTLKSDFTLSQGMATSTTAPNTTDSKIVTSNLNVNQKTVSTLGSALYYANGKESESRLYNVLCDGEDLRLTDFEASLGSALKIETWAK